MRNTLIVIVGPTGVGKSELCLDIAEHLGVPIINADSRQIFKELPIGTAAPTPEQQKRVYHYFVGNHTLDDYYSASLYEEDVMKLLQQMFSDDGHENHAALMSGGSMMYIDAVCKGIDDIPTIREDIREMMKQRLENEGLEALVAELKELDPELIIVVAYGKIIPQDILDLPKYGCINIHASLLPAYRGAAPIQWCVLN